MKKNSSFSKFYDGSDVVEAIARVSEAKQARNAAYDALEQARREVKEASEQLDKFKRNEKFLYEDVLVNKLLDELSSLMENPNKQVDGLPALCCSALMFPSVSLRINPPLRAEVLRVLEENNLGEPFSREHVPYKEHLMPDLFVEHLMWTVKVDGSPTWRLYVSVLPNC